MESACLRQTQLPHASRLFLDFTYQFDRVAQFYRYDPQRPESFHRAAAEIDFPDERRAALVDALRSQNEHSSLLDELAKPGTMAVVTGQQVGLFSGPAYTIFKALTAVRIAERLRSQGLAAVPVFWLATEDHDFAEVDHAWIFGTDHQPLRVRAGATPGPQQPVGGIRLNDIPLDALRQALAGFPYGEEIVEQVAAAYEPGRPMGEAFRQLLKRLLANFDLLYVDPLNEQIRRLGAPLLSEAVRTAPALKTRLLERDQQLRAAGYHTQVHLEQQTSLVFLLDGERRITLRSQNGDYLSKDARYSAAELMDRAEHLSPNALLRPVLQDYMLPTVAYVGGPAELAYFAQSQPLYEELLGRMPVVIHRAGFTLLDVRADKLMSRYGIGWPVVYEGEEGIRAHIAQRLVPPQLQSAGAAIHGQVDQALERYGTQIEEFDPTLAAALGTSRRKILYQLSKLEHKIARETIRRDQRADDDAQFLAGLLYPEKHLQERLYTILPFLAKHGMGLIETLHERVQLDCPDHQVLVI